MIAFSRASAFGVLKFVFVWSLVLGISCFDFTALAQALPIYTMAGHDAPGSANGVGSNARFNDPIGLTADAIGNIFVADSGNGTIRKIAPDGTVTTLAGLAGNFGSVNASGENARFFAPQGIAVDYTGTIYVADTANATIRKVSSAGLVAPFAGSVGNFNSFDGIATSANFYQPEGIAVDANRNVYVADAWNHTIRKITSLAVVTTVAGLAGNPGGRDGTNNTARFNRPAAVAVDSATNLFVADSLNHTIRKITPAGVVTTIAGLAGVWGSADGTNSGARFFLPNGICVLNPGEIIVADSGNHVLRKITASETNWIVTTIAGLPGETGEANGTGTAARFSFPAGLTSDTAGNVYIADPGNNAVRTTRIVPPTLQLSRAGNQLVLSWPISADAFALETASSISSIPDWSPVTSGIATVGDNFFFTNQPTADAAFFRLRK